MSGMAFGLIVILGIAVTNLFLGFSAALLSGRGPKSWQDVEDAFEFRFFSPKLLLPNISRFSRRSGAKDSPTVEQTVNVTSQDTGRAAGPEGVSDDIGGGSPADGHPRPVRLEGGKVKLAPRAVEESDELVSYDVVLDQQLDEWRNGDMKESAVCAAMLVVVDPGDDADAKVRSLVLDAVHTTLVDQVRRDRRVIVPQEGRFVWFLDDMDAEDTVLPVERIRQMIEKTSYQHQDQSVEVTIQMAIAAAHSDDRAKPLFDRLDTAFEFAQQSPSEGVALDLGDGPRMADPIAMEVHETEQTLA